MASVTIRVMWQPVPARPDGPRAFPEGTWPVVLSLVGFFVLDAVSLLAIARDAERFPNTDAAGMLAMSLVFIDLGFIVFFAIAAGTRIRRWLWRRSHA